VLVAWGTLELILALRPASLEELEGVRIELPILLWSAAISVVTGILFGCAPALFAGSRAVGDILRRVASTASSGTALRRMRSALIVIEIALSLVLLIGAGLLVRSFAALQAMPVNFEPRGLVAANVMFPPTWTPDVRAARRKDLLHRLRATPGVSEASIGMMPGLGWRAFALEAQLGAEESKSVGEYSTTFVTPDYFRIVGTKLVAGRVPDSLAATIEPRQALVNRTLARRLWGDREPLGARLHEKGGPPGLSSSYIVVGVVDDIQLPGRRSAAGPADIYVPLPAPLPGLPVIIRTTLPESAIIAAVRRAVAEYDGALRSVSQPSHGAVLQTVTVGETYVRESLAPTRFAMALLLAFAMIALVLSAVGLYGVIAYSVTQRTREIGVRIALGADERSVERLVVGAGLRLTALGVVVGIGVALISTRLLTGLLYGVSPGDPTSFAAITVLVVMTALLASYVPARRAVNINPIAALRAE
jgi:putative ABC transport system permease protein